MIQGVLPFKYEEEKTQTGMTALAGLPVYLDLAKVIGLSKSIGKYLKVRENSQGWTDPQMTLNTWWHEQGIILHTEFRDGFELNYLILF